MHNINKRNVFAVHVDACTYTCTRQCGQIWGWHGCVSVVKGGGEQWFQVKVILESSRHTADHSRQLLVFLDSLHIAVREVSSLDTLNLNGKDIWTCIHTPLQMLVETLNRGDFP